MSECPECEGAVMDMDTDTSFKCPRCGYRCDEFGKKLNGCGKKFEFMEGDNIYDGICGDDDDGLCQDCSPFHGSRKQ